MIKPYEEEVIFRMFDKGIIGMDYTSVEKIASKIKWSDIASQFRIKKSFQSVIRELENKELVTDHGKSGRVASLTSDGVRYAKFIIERGRPF